MAVQVGINSWITIAEADAYLTDRIDAVEWFTLADTGAAGSNNKTSYIVSAFYWLYASELFVIPKSNSDQDVKDAQAEVCLFLLKYSSDYERRQALISSGVKDFTRSKWSETLNEVSVPVNIRGMLHAYDFSNAIVQMYPEDYEDEWT